MASTHTFRSPPTTTKRTTLCIISSFITYFCLAVAQTHQQHTQPLLKPFAHPQDPATSNLGLTARSMVSNEVYVSRIEPRTFETGIGDNWNDLHVVNISGWLTLWGESSPSNDTSSQIRLLSCDTKEFTNATEYFLNATHDKPLAVVLYSLEEDECIFTGEDNDGWYQYIYSMTWKDVSQNFVDALKQPENKFMKAQIAYNFTAERETNDQNNTSGNNSQGQDILGPAPTTAVAMIILYSITGVVTFLFLTVITIGALRAHRHPERYGPRPGDFGRGRQTRAQGIARAVLDTIPLVRFGGGSKEGDAENPVKAEDATELQDAPTGTSGTENHNTTAAPAVAGDKTKEQQQDHKDAQVNPEGSTEAEASSTAPATKKTTAGDSSTNVIEPEEDEGATGSADAISPAKPEKKTEEVPIMNPSHLICPICMENFVEGEQLRVLPCRHPFHPACVDPWLLNVAGSCPVCRVDLHPSLSAGQEGSGPPRSPGLTPEPAVVDRNAPALKNSRFARYREILRHPTSSAAERESALRQLQANNAEREQRRRSHSGSEQPPTTSESAETSHSAQAEPEPVPIPTNRLSFFSRRRTSWLVQHPAPERPPVIRANSSNSA